MNITTFSLLLSYSFDRIDINIKSYVEDFEQNVTNVLDFQQNVAYVWILVELF